MKWSVVMTSIGMLGLFGLMIASFSIDEESEIDPEEFLGPESMMINRHFKEAA